MFCIRPLEICVLAKPLRIPVVALIDIPSMPCLTRIIMKILALPLLIFFAAGTACAEAPKPLLWKVSDADNSLYLLGSFHMLKESDYPLAKSTDEAFDDAEQLYFEVSPEEMNDPALAQNMMQSAIRKDGKTLQQTLPQDSWKQFETYASERNLPAANFQNFDPWFVTLIMSLTEMQRNGLNPEIGLDRHFMARAKNIGKPTHGLETAESQIAVLGSMSPELQIQSMQEMLDDLSHMKKDLDEMHELWRKADDKALFNKMAGELQNKYPKLYQNINVDRNKAWLPKLDALLKDNDQDDILVVVGSMHLLGKDGVVNMLKEKGYKVERIK